MTELHLAVSQELLQKVIQKYHYRQEDEPELRRAADRMESAMKGRSGFWCRLPDMIVKEHDMAGGSRQEHGMSGGSRQEHESGSGSLDPGVQGPSFAEAVLTLGAGIDELQNDYTEKEEFCECYMVETIGNELLLDCYVMFNEWVAQHTGWHVARYHFFGSRDDLPAEGMRNVLEHWKDADVWCNEAYCLVPKMSVVFLAELTRDENQVCEGICMGCGNRNCPNRMGTLEDAQRWPDVPGNTLPYGDTRILEGAARIDGCEGGI